MGMWKTRSLERQPLQVRGEVCWGRVVVCIAVASIGHAWEKSWWIHSCQARNYHLNCNLPFKFGKLHLPVAWQISLLCFPPAHVKQWALLERATCSRFLFSAIFSDHNKFVIFAGILPKQMSLAWDMPFLFWFPNPRCSSLSSPFPAPSVALSVRSVVQTLLCCFQGFCSVRTSPCFSGNSCIQIATIPSGFLFS